MDVKNRTLNMNNSVIGAATRNASIIPHKNNKICQTQPNIETKPVLAIFAFHPVHSPYLGREYSPI